MVDTGSEPSFASAGTSFFVAFRSTAAPSSFAISKLDGAFATLQAYALHLDTSALRTAVLASGDGEAIAVYAVTGSPDQIWLRRLCGP